MLPFKSVFPISPLFNMVLFFLEAVTSLFPLLELLHMTWCKKKQNTKQPTTNIVLLFGYFSSWSQQIPVLSCVLYLFAISSFFSLFLLDSRWMDTACVSSCLGATLLASFVGVLPEILSIFISYLHYFYFCFLLCTLVHLFRSPL